MRFRRLAATCALMLIPSMTISAWAQCQAVTGMNEPAPMACCANGHDQCPMHRSTSQRASDCCQHESQRHQTLAAAELPTVHVLAVTFTRVATLVSPAAFASAPGATRSTRYCSPPSSPPTPRPIRSTVLLI
ncbi:MAG TPA: hypothetical protein VFX12_12740 [Vicinamibacterales bacterium]|nr:hypothetical protein [Vicinamibacterales bacterium]